MIFLQTFGELPLHNALDYLGNGRENGDRPSVRWSRNYIPLGNGRYERVLPCLGNLSADKARVDNVQRRRADAVK